MICKSDIIRQFNLTPSQTNKIDKYIYEICERNKRTNIVGKTTLIHPWNSHVLDSIQIIKFINNKNSSILDMGTGAGIPGIFLAINDFKNVSLIDSNSKKIKFLEHVASKLNIDVKIYYQRIESLINTKFDYLISRALAKLNKLFYYSQQLLNKKTVLIFLKGKNISDEIQEANKVWKFSHELHQSCSDNRGKILVVKNLSKITKYN